MNYLYASTISYPSAEERDVMRKVLLIKSDWLNTYFIQQIWDISYANRFGIVWVPLQHYEKRCKKLAYKIESLYKVLVIMGFQIYKHRSVYNAHHYILRYKDFYKFMNSGVKQIYNRMIRHYEI